MTKILCRNTILHQAKNLKLWVDKEAGAATLEAKSDEKGIPGKKAIVGKTGKEAVGITKQKKPLAGKKKGCSYQETH